MGGSESSERSEYCERVAGAEYEKCLDYVPSHICEKISDATFVSCMLSGENSGDDRDHNSRIPDYPSSGESDNSSAWASMVSPTSPGTGCQSMKLVSNSSSVSLPEKKMFCAGVDCVDSKNESEDNKLRESKVCRNSDVCWLQQDWMQCRHITREELLACSGFCLSLRTHFARTDLETRNILKYHSWCNPIAFVSSPQRFSNDYKTACWSYCLKRSPYFYAIPRGSHTVDYYTSTLLFMIFIIHLPDDDSTFCRLSSTYNWYRSKGETHPLEYKQTLLTRNYFGDSLSLREKETLATFS